MKYVHIQRTAELASRQQLWCVCSTNIGSCSWHSALFGNPYFKMTDFLNECIGEHEYKVPRKDGNQRLVIDKALIDEFAEPEGRAFNVSTQEKLEVFCCSFEKNVLLRMCIQQQMRIFSMSH